MQKEVVMGYLKVPDMHFIRGTGEKPQKDCSQDCQHPQQNQQRTLIENKLEVLVFEPLNLVLYQMTTDLN